MKLRAVCRRLVHRLVILSVVLSGGMSMSSDVLAHPHAWVDIRSAPVFDDDGRLVAIEQEWFFDYFYSAFIREELEGDGGVTQAGLDTIAAENIAELEQFGYFTDVRSGQNVAELGQPYDVATGYQDDRLWMRFVVPLAAPADPNGAELSYAIYDPTYYVELLHLRDELIMLVGGANVGCQAALEPPSPTMEAVALANSLSIDEQPDFTLGELFAEWVHVTCP
jgi:ABC-type uncharacterized transport system substrate-binding protein